MKTVMVFLDESGHIHANAPQRYFAVGGYLCPKEDSLKIKSAYKKINQRVKIETNMDSETELKARVMTEDQKIAFLSRVEERPGFQGVGIIFDKKKMSKKITSESVFYNYSVTCLFEEVIFPMFDIGQNDDPVTHIRFELVCDNRPISVEEKKSLENHLNAVFYTTIARSKFLTSILPLISEFSWPT